MDSIVTRFAPSPTGYLHVGGARTALFNWLHARHCGGKFILRIEDTDTQRSTQESVDAILDSLTWLGIDWDEGPFFQSQRMDLYRSYIDQLIGAGDAYYCTCSPQKIDAMREKAMATGGKPRYDGTCRDKDLAASNDAVVRFKAPLAGATPINDLIKTPIVFQNEELDDFIIQRSDGTPTYNFVVVIDDMTMGVNTVIRGDDHISNTPKQILLYKALGHPLPGFGHVPMVLGQDRARLSKRHGAASVTAYRELGYLPEALINYLVRLGWSHGDQEFFTRDDLIKKFDVAQIGRSAGTFDADKLLALNQDHIKAAAPAQLAPLVLPFLKAAGIDTQPDAYLEAVIETLHARSKTLIEMAQGADFYYTQGLVFDPPAAKKFLKGNVLEPMRSLLTKLSQADDFSEALLEEVFKSVLDEFEIKLGKIAQPVRVALTGRTFSPGIFEIMTVLGRERVVERLQKAIEFIEKRVATS